MRTARHPSRRARLAGAAFLAPFALGLVACGTDATDDPSTVEAGSPDAVVSATAAPPSPSTPSGSTGASSAAPAGTSLQTAAETALDAVEGTLFGIDRGDAGGWEVTVVEPDGTQNAVDTSADGATIIQGPEVSSDDSTDLEDRLRLLDASVDYNAAITVALGAVPDSEVSALDLEVNDDLPTWVVDLTDGTRLDIDASSAVVKRIEAG